MRPASETAPSTIDVDVAQVGSALQTVTLPAGSKKADALRAAGYDPGLSAKVNGVELQDDDVLEDGDRVTVGAKAKGNIV